MREDWIECTLGDLLTLKNGFAFQSAKKVASCSSHQYLTNVQCWNRHNHGQTIHPKQKFISMNLLQMSCVIT